MKRIYYVVESNDGSQQSGKLDTIKQARAELKSIIEEDKKEFGLDEGDIDYYIAKYTETEEKITCDIVK